MTETKHTPGPLTVIKRPGSDDNQFVIESDMRDCPMDKWDDCYVNIGGYFGSYGPHVFAAAPALLEALEWALSQQPADDSCDTWVSSARAAISRAAISRATTEH